eukprot:749818-Hanusia_phi.AAC.1
MKPLRLRMKLWRGRGSNRPCASNPRYQRRQNGGASSITAAATSLEDSTLRQSHHDQRLDHST